jgi:hypothetical protein
VSPSSLALTPAEEARLERLQRLAWLLDASIGLPFTRFRFGFDAVVGLIPGLGDAIGALFSAYILLEAARFGVPRGLLLRMVANIALDTGVGTIPLLGDLFDAVYKSDLRNLSLLRRHLNNPVEARRASRRFLFGMVAAIVLLAAAAFGGAILLVKLLLGLLAH